MTHKSIIHGATPRAYLDFQKHIAHQLTRPEMYEAMLRYMLFSNICFEFPYRAEGQEMVPIISHGETLLVRHLPFPNAHKYAGNSKIISSSRQVFVGDVVLMRDPSASKIYLVRRVAAVGGQTMASTDEKDEPFVLEEKEFWVLSDNKLLKAEESQDSRSFGPFETNDIVGRVIYLSPSNHGPVANSDDNAEEDSAVLELELDIDELEKRH